MLSIRTLIAVAAVSVALTHAQVPTGAVLAYAGKEAPKGWLLCDGSEKPIDKHPDLAKVLGATFGTAPDKMFRLPDLRGRVVAGAGQGPGTSDRLLGARFGQESVTLEANQIPPHTHAFSATTSGNVNRGQCCVSNPNNGDYGGGQNIHQHNVSGATSSASISAPPEKAVETTPPTTVLSYIIKE